jgi:hypothetical protein
MSGVTYYYKLEDIDTRGISTFMDGFNHDPSTYQTTARAGSLSQTRQPGGNEYSLVPYRFGWYPEPYYALQYWLL